jgi:transglutaminase-like putative cysteine protease
MTVQRLIAVIMILGSSVVTAWASGDITFPAILCMLGLLGVQRRFTWDIRPERQFITPLLLLLLAVLFALHCRYAHVRVDQAAAFAWQTIARYFLASMILLLFLRPHRTHDRGRTTEGRGQMNEPLRPLSSVLRWAAAPRAVPLTPAPQNAAKPSSRSEALALPPVALPASLGLFHLASVMAAGQVLLLDDRYVAFRLTELLSVILVILYAVSGGSQFRISDFGFRIGAGVPVRYPRSAIMSPPGSTGGRNLRPGSWLPLSLLLLVAVNFGWIGGSLLYRQVEVINFLPAWLSRGSVILENTTTAAARVGFTTSGKLSTVLAIKEDADTAPVLTVTGSNPTYLRAMAFETYNQSSWHDLSYREALTPEQNTPFGMLLSGRTFLFRLHDAGADEDSSLRETIIRHESSVGDSMFTPLGTYFVEAPFGLLMRDDDDTVTSPNVRNRQSYRVGYAATPVSRPPAGSQLRRLTAVPSQLVDQRLQQIKTGIFRDCKTTTDKINAVTAYFHTTYTYSLGLEVPPDKDALSYFLREASSGYCEYFASGAAILLRMAGVPTRYVTGFLVTERGGDGRTWIARNMDAHAWAEAWDAENRQWVIVEATTQEGLGDASLADELSRAAGGGQPLLAQLAEALYEYGLFGVIGRLFISYGLPTGLGLSVVFFAAAFWVARRRRRRTGSPARRPTSSEVLVLHRLLTAMDRRVRAVGYRREPGETLHEFAERILESDSSNVGRLRTSLRETSDLRQDEPRHRSTSDVGAWYLQYAGLRYAPHIDPAQIYQLQQSLLEIPNAT